MEDRLIEFLKIVSEIKKFRDEDGAPYSCFLGYSRNDRICLDLRSKICGICRISQIPSDDWIEGARSALEQNR